MIITASGCSPDLQILIERQERSVALIKPDGLAGGAAADIEHVFARGGLTVVDRRRQRLSRQVAAQLHDADKRRREPIKYEIAATHLSSGLVEAWMLAGDDAIQVGVALKAILRQHYGSNKLFNLVHTAGDVGEAVRQVGILFGETSEEDNPERMKAGESDGMLACGLTMTQLQELVSELLTTTSAPAGPDARQDGYALLISDDMIHDIDEIVASIGACLPFLDARTRVRRAYEIEAFGGTRIDGLAPEVVGPTWYELMDRHLMTVTIVPPRSIIEHLPEGFLP